METTEQVKQELIHGLEEDEIRLFVGQYADNYINAWKKVKDPVKYARFNIAAFFFDLFWLGYRKMYGIAALYLGVFIILTIIDQLFDLNWLTYLYAGISAAIGTVGNSLYYKHMVKKINNIKEQYQDPETRRNELIRQGGGSWRGVGIATLMFIAYLIIGISIYTAIPGEKFDYTGEYKDGVPHGQGTALFPDGAMYEGEFKDGFIHGNGVLTYPDGAKFEGEFTKDDLLQGVFTHPIGERYEGEFKDWMFHGQGTWTNQEGIKYVGEHKKNKFHGEGVYYLPNGEKFKGVFRDGDFHEGIWTSPDGGKYEGEFSEGMFHGQGIKYDPDGEIIHDGEWSFNEPLKQNM